MSQRQLAIITTDQPRVHHHDGVAMRKNSAEGIQCTYCDKPALPETEPPVCEEHVKMKKQASKKEPETLKELETAPVK